MGYFRILAAIPGFFLSSLLVMWLWGPIAQHFGMPPIDYPYSMLVTITAWLAVAPLAAAGHRWHW
jgi:hypothetical protein